MSDTAIAVEKLGKRYLIRHDRLGGGDGLRHAVESAIRRPFSWLRGTPTPKPSRDFLWAVRDVSFTVARGEAVGVIGHNGAGKSTLLKLLSRITEPSVGQIRYRGRVASLLEVGTGFHQELTGRENIFLNAAILGMRRVDIQRRFDEIVAFSEVERFLDTPVKHYSSGMYVRLAFGVAAHLEPEILLVDEVLAVGDASFQQKCLGKMNSVVSEGRTVLFVSHNMAAIAALCTRGVLLERGQVSLSGAPQTVIDAYLSRSRSMASAPLRDRLDRRGAGRVRFTRVTVLNERSEPVETVASGQDLAIRLDYETSGADSLRNTSVQIKFAGSLGQPLFACLSASSSSESLTLTSRGCLICRIPHLPLMPGVYTFTIWCTVGDVLEDYVSDAGSLSVADGDFFGTGKLPPNAIGDFLVAHSWSVSADS